MCCGDVWRPLLSVRTTFHHFREFSAPYVGVWGVCNQANYISVCVGLLRHAEIKCCELVLCFVIFIRCVCRTIFRNFYIFCLLRLMIMYSLIRLDGRDWRPVDICMIMELQESSHQFCLRFVRRLFNLYYFSFAASLMFVEYNCSYSFSFFFQYIY